MKTFEQLVKEQEDKKYHAARYVYPRQTLLMESQKWTYKEWWEDMFKDNYALYIQQKIKEKQGEQ